MAHDIADKKPHGRTSPYAIIREFIMALDIADKKPHGRTSPYAFFMRMCREEYERQHPNENMAIDIVELAKKCSAKWKTMSKEDKNMFYDLAQNDKVHHEKEMANNDGPLPARGRKRKQKKDPNAPKRALSSYFCFAAHERPNVRKDNPELHLTEIAKVLGARWNKISPEEKVNYEQMAAKDKERYLQEMKDYKAGTFAKKHVLKETESDSEVDDDKSYKKKYMKDCKPRNFGNNDVYGRVPKKTETDSEDKDDKEEN